MKLSACGEIVRLGDPDRFRTALFAPPAPREHLFALYAFNLELAKIAPMVSEPMMGEIRLQWWREVIGQIYGGGAVRAHEVATPLAAAVAAADLPRASFDALIDARAADLEADLPVGDALIRYIEDTGGGVTLLAGRSLAPDVDEAVARDTGFAIGAARYLMAMPKLAALGRKPLSMDQVDALAVEGRLRLARARAKRALVPKAATPALLETVTAAYNLSSPTARSPFREKAAILWAALRGRW